MSTVNQNQEKTSNPSPEMLGLRDKLVLNKSGISLARKAKSFALPTANGGVCEIVADFDASAADSVTLTFSNSLGEKTEMTYDRERHTMSFDRRESGITGFSENFPAVTTAPTFESDGKMSIRIFIDRSSFEYFGNEGRSVMTNIVFPTEPYTSMSIVSAGGKTRLKNIKIYSLTAK